MDFELFFAVLLCYPLNTHLLRKKHSVSNYKKGFQKKMGFQVKYLIYLKRNISRGASSKKLFNMCFTAFPNSFYGPGACPHLWKKCNVSASICLLFQWDVLKRFRKEHSHPLGHFFQLVIEGNQASAVQRGPSNGQTLTFSRRCSRPRRLPPGLVLGGSGTGDTGPVVGTRAAAGR